MKKNLPLKKKFLKHGYYLAFLVLILIPVGIILHNSIITSDFKQDLPTNNDPEIEPTADSLTTNDFLYYKDIYIDPSKVTDTQFNFPVLLLIYDSDLQKYAQPDGDDIVFYSNSNNQWLPHEIERYTQYYDGSKAELMVWVKVPSISDSVQTVIRMYFGNPYLGSQVSPNSLWDSYRGVWHLSEDPSYQSNPETVIEDSTSHNYNGNPENSMTSEDLVDGHINRGIEFDGDDDYIDFGDVSLQSYDISLSFWMETDYKKTMSCIDKFPYDLGLFEPAGFSVRLESDGDISFVLGNKGFFGGIGSITTSNKDYSQNWVHISCTYTRSNGRAYIYLNGNQAASGTIFIPGFIDNNDVHLRFGKPDDVDYGSLFEGVLDEVRLSNFVRSASWIATEYTNQNEPEEFYSSIGPLMGPGVNTPSVIFLSPLDSRIYDPPSLTISAIITDYETTIASAQVTIDDGNTLKNFQMTQDQVYQDVWNYKWDYSDLSYNAQDYTISITAHDSEGYTNDTESVLVTIRKDLTEPAINFLSPDDGTSIGDSLTITAEVIDGEENDPGDGDVFATIKYQGIFSFNLELDRIGETNNWTGVWSNITLPDYQLGDYTIDITARDSSWYQNEQTIGSRTITLIDIYAPTVTIDSMYLGPYGKYQDYEKIEIKASITDSKSLVTEAIVMISGSETLNIPMQRINGDEWVCSWTNVTDYTNGDYTITIWAIDGVGNVNQQKSITVTIENLQSPAGDNGPPLLVIIGIIAIIGSVGSVGTYGLVRVVKKSKNAPNLEEKLLKLQKGIKKTEISLKETKSSLKGSTLHLKNETISKKKNKQYAKKNQRPFPISQSRNSNNISKMRIQDEIMNLELNGKTADEKLKILKKITEEADKLN